jgi:hypothetical protein
VRTSPEDLDGMRAEVRQSLLLVGAVVAMIVIGLVIGFAF